MADPSRSEPATPRRKEEARRRGQVAKSNELTAALLLLAVLLFFRLAGGDLLRALSLEAARWWGALGPRATSPESVMAAGSGLIARTLLMLAPLMLVAAAVAIGVNVAQVGMQFTTEPIAPKPDNLNPVQGFQRIASQRTAVEALKAVVKLVLVGWVIWTGLNAYAQDVLLESVRPVDAGFAAAIELTWRIGLRVVLVLLAIAILDYLYQRYAWERSLRMTRQEVKDEYRQTEGDPLVKARIRQLQREASRRRMIQEVPAADVVITNPVHLAVAVRYEPGASRAPQIVAKGARLVAERIKQVAREHGVPVHEDPPLARSLFAVAVGGELPAELYTAVARVLAFVYHAGQSDKEQKVLEGVRMRRMKEAAGLG